MIERTVFTTTHGDERIETNEITRKVIWNRHKTWWQLPCGCIGPDIWDSADEEQAECTDCGRRWWHMGVRGNHCAMLDGKPQGKPLLILTEDQIYHG